MFLSDDRRDAFLPLSAAGVPAEAARRLEALGITTFEELRDAWTYGDRQHLTDYLGESPARFTTARPAPSLTRGVPESGPGTGFNLAAGGPARPLVRRPRGLSLTAAQRNRRAEPPESLDDPPALTGARGTRPRVEVVSLIDRFPQARNQGERGTCVAFVSVPRP